MKTIIKIAAIFTLFFSFISCELDDKNVIAQPGESPTLVSPEEGTSIILDPVNPSNPGITVVWNHAKYALNTEINYTVEIAMAATDFANPIVLQTTTSRQITLSMEQFNQKCLDAGLVPFASAGIDIRVKAALGTSNSLEVISNKITINVTPYTTALPLLAVPGNHQGWDPPTAPRLASSAYGATDFEGFAWLDGDYKFLLPNASGVFQWGNTDFGDDGSFSGILVQGSPTNCNVGTAGYYYVKANTKATGPGALSYSADPASWAITGAATPNGWPDPAPDHDMTYNPATKKWTITIALSAGEFKFRANNAWGLNLGDDNNGDGFMDFGGPNLSIVTPGTYTVTLDLSNPRAYTYSVQ
jgi:starch-binding outer membrane protein SusE/F